MSDMDQLTNNTPVEPAKHSFSNIDINSETSKNAFNIKVIGVGGAGCNVINYIANNVNNIKDACSIYAFNTDLASLKSVKNVDNLFLLNKEELKGYGTGFDPAIARNAIIHDQDIIKKELTNTDILIIIAGMGKATGSGAAPELARIAKELNILTVGILCMPAMSCEGRGIFDTAFNSMQQFASYADCTTTISNDKIVASKAGMSFYEAYDLANKHMANIVSSIINMIANPSFINIDFADLRAFFKASKFFSFGSINIDGQDLTKEKVKQELNQSIRNGWSDVNVLKAKKVIANLTISRQTPTTIIADVNACFGEITHNDKISLTAGVNYQDDNKIDISYLIAGENYSGDFAGVFEANSGLPDSWNEPTLKVEPVVESEQNEYDKLMSEVMEASTPTTDLTDVEDKKDSTENIG